MRKLAIITTLVTSLTATSAFAGGEYQDAVNNLQFITNPNSSYDNLNVNTNKQRNISSEKLTAMTDDKQATNTAHVK